MSRSSSPGPLGHEPNGSTASSSPGSVRKSPTGITGLDLISGGGLPTGRTTLVSGSAGSGKTMLALEFVLRGALEFGEPGVYVAFEESVDELFASAESLGFDVSTLVRDGLVAFDAVDVGPGGVPAAGAYDLEGLFIRLGHAIDRIGAKRVVLDTLEALFSSLPEPALLRAELVRLFRWLKARGITALVTAERSDAAHADRKLEDFVADCVIALEHSVHRDSSTRHLRIVKYRGSAHGTDEYPFLIGDTGISVVPLTEVGLVYEVSSEIISTGVADLDSMLGGGGVYRGSSVLLSGTAGTGKSTVAASFVDAACRRGERCIFFSFEEGEQQIVRNLRSVGLDLQQHVDAGALRIRSTRPTGFGLETHLSRMHRDIEEFDPRLIVVDPISTFDTITDLRGVGSLVTRLVDISRSRGITTVFVHLSTGGAPLDSTDGKISSVADVWIQLRDIESNGERNRALYLLKARGMVHSNQVRELQMASDGIKLVPVYIDEGGVQVGSARVAGEARARLEHLERQHELERAEADLARLEALQRAALTEHGLAVVAAERRIRRLRDADHATVAEHAHLLRDRGRIDREVPDPVASGDPDGGHET